MAQPIEYALRFISQALKKEQEARAFATESILNAIRKYFSADNKKKRNIATERTISEAIEQDKNTVLGFYLQSIQEKGALNADETLDAEIASAIAVLANTEEEITTETLSKIAYDSYDRAVHEGWLKGSIKAIALTLAGYKLQQSMVQKGIERAWSGDTYKNRIYKRFFKLSNKLKEEAVKAKQYGRDVKDVERTIKSYMDSDAKHGMPTLLETEANAVHSFFRVEAFKKTGVENYRFDAKLDSKTSDICSRMDGKIFALKDAQSGVNCPAMHPRCRSDIQAVYKDEYLTHDGKKIKMPDGKYITVDRNIAYEKWRELYRSKLSGASSGAWTSENDPTGKKREEIAEKLYSQIIRRKKEYEIKAIAKNTAYTLEEVSRIYDHIFIREHNLGKQGIRKFDPDYYMAHSWLRLREGKKIFNHDLTMLKHELAEEKIMGESLEILYEDVHKEVEKVYNYSKELEEYLKTHDA